MEAIDTKDIKDAVCKNNGYRDWNHFLDVLSCGEPIEEAQESVFNEVISEVAKQVAEATKQSCADSAETKIEEVYVGDMDSSGSLYRKVASIDVNSILNAPIPEIK